MAKRLKMVSLRGGKGLTQDDIAKRLDITRETYSRVERGDADGTVGFWCKMQEVFSLSDNEVWELVKDGKE